MDFLKKPKVRHDLKIRIRIKNRNVQKLNQVENK